MDQDNRYAKVAQICTLFTGWVVWEVNKSQVDGIPGSLGEDDLSL